MVSEYLVWRYPLMTYLTRKGYIIPKRALTRINRPCRMAMPSIIWTNTLCEA